MCRAGKFYNNSLTPPGGIPAMKRDTSKLYSGSFDRLTTQFQRILQSSLYVNSHVTHYTYKRTAMIKVWKHIYLPMECNVRIYLNHYRMTSNNFSTKDRDSASGRQYLISVNFFLN
jgi:hypothetical protein